jgi:hypothetical protein
MPSNQRSIKSCSRIKILNRNNLELWKIILLLIEHLIKYRVGQRRKKEENMSMKKGWGCRKKSGGRGQGKRRRWNRHRRSNGRGRRTLR